jgi:short-subunit dehydrogenase
MKRNLRDLRILLTGASRGIGRALAELLAREGARLVLAARSVADLEEIAQNLTAQGVKVIVAPTDITSPEERQRLFETIDARLGGLDVLINNAGIAACGHFADSTEEILRQIMEVNFFAPAELIRLAVPRLEQGQQPAIVNVGSMCGRRGLPAWSEYSASKFALCGLTEALRGELARFDIDILLVLPGLTRTDLRKNLLRSSARLKIDLTRGMPPDKVAGHIVRLLQNNWTETVLGWEARMILAGNRFFPRLANFLMARKVKQLYGSSKSPMTNDQ